MRCMVTLLYGLPRKSEGRNPKAEGNPKSEIRNRKAGFGTRAHFGNAAIVIERAQKAPLPGPLPFGRGEGDGGSAGMRPSAYSFGFRPSDFFRISALGFRPFI